MTVKRRLGDRRARPRFEIVGQLWGSLEVIEPMGLRNIGRGGALVEARVALRADTVHRVRFHYGGSVTDLQVRVRHVTPLTGGDEADRYLIGLEFLGVPQAAIEHIDRLLEASARTIDVPKDA